MKKFVIGILLTAVAVPVSAQSGSITGEVILGKTTIDVEGTDGDDTSVGARAVLQLSDMVAAEIAYQDYGTVSWTVLDVITEKTETEAFTVGIKGVFPLDNAVSLNARIGLAMWDIDVDITHADFPGVTLSGNDSGTDLYYGIGAQYQVNHQFVLGVEYTISEFGVSLDGDLDGADVDVDVDTLAFTAGFRF